MKKLLKMLFNHERYQSISVILTLIFVIFLASCDPQAKSLIDPGKKISRLELDGEIALLQARIDTELKSLEQQEAIRTLLLNLAATAARTGTFPFTEAILGAVGMLGTGAVIDNVRKRRDVTKLENQLIESEKS